MFILPSHRQARAKYYSNLIKHNWILQNYFSSVIIQLPLSVGVISSLVLLQIEQIITTRCAGALKGRVRPTIAQLSE
jgi:hypothetical protein